MLKSLAQSDFLSQQWSFQPPAFIYRGLFTTGVPAWCFSFYRFKVESVSRCKNYIYFNQSEVWNPDRDRGRVFAEISSCLDCVPSPRCMCTHTACAFWSWMKTNLWKTSDLSSTPSFKHSWVIQCISLNQNCLVWHKLWQRRRGFAYCGPLSRMRTFVFKNDE